MMSDNFPFLLSLALNTEIHPSDILYYENRAGRPLRTHFPSSDIPPDAEIIIYMTSSNDSGEQVYCYLKIPYSNYDIIKSMLGQRRGFDPRDYGSIVTAGLGEPTDEVKMQITKEYGIVPIDIH